MQNNSISVNPRLFNRHAINLNYDWRTNNIKIEINIQFFFSLIIVGANT